ncbi:MAG TPA: hypothetical protein VHM24_00705, partial [Gemmatimonadaceae bacterium]|nr:hypothetical protein [Gemmatimonadaceae bacterium]
MSAIPGQGYAQPPGGNAVTAPVAAALTRIPVRADSRLWLEGSSNVRDWTCKATAMDASIEIDPAKARAATLDASAVRGVKVKVPVRMLKCGDRHMEAHMYTALKAPPEPAE